jgi:hypothetical protein
LGEAASKVKNSASLAAVANIDLTPSEAPPKMKAVAGKRTASNGKAVASMRYAKAKVASRTHAKSKTVASRASSKTRSAAKSHNVHGRATAMVAERSAHAGKRAAKLAAKASAKKFAAKSAGSRGHATKMASAWNPYKFSAKHRAS